MAAIMLQGTGSDVGKSVLVAALARIFSDRGFRVAPFKPQNMSNNAAATADGGEIGRAQALQALAARIAPSVDMNPVLIKPESDLQAQVIVLGRPRGKWQAGDFKTARASLLPTVLESFERLERSHDFVIVEGAGSLAETNLRQGDIANMGFARAAQVPVIVVGDIDRGGVIAALVGSHAVLDDADRAMVKGFIVNRMRGDVSLFDAGMDEIRRRTGWHATGLVPWLPAARRLPAEDAVVLDDEFGGIRSDELPLAVVPMLPHISNFDDFDPLRAEAGIRLEMLPPGKSLPAQTRLVILPGSKSVIADLRFLKAQHWDEDIRSLYRRGGHVWGICGGLQMLGDTIADPEGIESQVAEDRGIGLLPVHTVLKPGKVVRQVRGHFSAGNQDFEGYEIHTGITTGPTRGDRLLRFSDGADEGFVSADGRIVGTYVHGLFDLASARAAMLARLQVASSGGNHADRVEADLDALADHCRRHLDVDRIAQMAGIGKR